MVIEITTGRIRDLASFDHVKGLRAQAADALGAAASLDSLYCISFADAAVPADRERMAAAINMVHEILMRCDSGKVRLREIPATVGNATSSFTRALRSVRYWVSRVPAGQVTSNARGGLGLRA